MKKSKRKTVFLLLLCLIVLLMTAGCGQKEGSLTTYRTGSVLKNQQKQEQKESPDTLYMIEELNTLEETISLLSLDSGKLLRYSYSLTTKFQDKYGNSTSSMNFHPGLIVTLGELLDSKALSSVQLSDQVWRNDEVKNFSIAENALTIGDTLYRITKDTHVFSDQEEISIDQIGQDDMLRVVGQDKNILSIAVITGHGYLKLNHTSAFTNSLMGIGNRIYTMITGDITIEVPEGTYNVTVANDGYGGTTPVTITRNEITELDLSQLQGEGPKYCTLSFQVSVAQASIYLDNVLVNANEATQVKYGKHSLKVVADGYDTWEKTLVVNSASATIVLDLTDEEEATTNTSTSTTTKDEDEDQEDEESSSSTTSDATDAEVDYLSTISDMISSMLSSD